jgi:hypothetical protein
MKTHYYHFFYFYYLISSFNTSVQAGLWMDIIGLSLISEKKKNYQIFIYLQNSFPINYFFFSMINSANALETLGEKLASNIEET